MLLDKDRDRNIVLLGKKVYIFCRIHIAVGHRIQRGSPGPLRLRYAVADSVWDVGMCRVWDGSVRKREYI